MNIWKALLCNFKTPHPSCQAAASAEIRALSTTREVNRRIFKMTAEIKEELKEKE